MNERLTQQFRSPANGYRPRMRWWLPGAFMNDEEIRREIEWMAEQGYGGAEIIHFFPIPSADVDPSEYGNYGFGGELWNSRMKAALLAAIPLNFQLDFTIGPLWPIATPAIMDKNDERCAQGLHACVASFKGTFNGAIPVPDTLDPDRPYQLVAVTSARRRIDASIGKSLTLDLETAVDLTSGVIGNLVDWTAPGEGEWCLFGFWSQTNGQSNDSIGAPVVDHYSKAAADAVTGFWDEHLFADAEIRALYGRNAGSLFCDSIELNATMLGGMYGATPMTVSIWSPSVLDEFRARRGYDLTPYLPAIFVKGLYQLGAGNRTDGDSEFDFDDRSSNRGIRNDFFATLTDMFRDHHLRTLRQWANSRGMKLRYQTYGMTTELTAGLAEVDIPETESLGFKDSTDGYRLQAGAVHLYDREIYSFEVGAVMGYGYKQTWTGLDYGLLRQLHRGFAAGVNQAVLHGMSYETADASGHFEAMFNWPGMSLMGAMFSNEWGARQPNSRHSASLTNYIARNQFVLRLGKPKLDLAIYRHHIDGIHEGMGIDLTPYELEGYTYDFVSPALLEAANARVGTSGGRPALEPEGPAYRAIVIDVRKDTETGAWRPSDLSVETADRLIVFAREGLPIVIVGDAPCSVLSYHGSKEALARRGAELRQRIESLVRLPGVLQVTSREEAVDALARLSVRPASQVRSGPPLLSARRHRAGVDYYYLYNPNVEETFEGEVELEGAGYAYRLNAWDGSASPMTSETGKGGGIAVKLRLSPNETAIVAIAPEWTGELADEEVEPTDIGDRISLDHWTLSVDRWMPGEHPTQTKHETISMNLDKLQCWTEIPELRNVSGIGRYRTEFQLDARAGKRKSVFLDLGKATDTFRVYVNGQEATGADQIGRRISIGAYVRPGERNVLEVEVATTLNNALAADDPNRRPQESGLIGPVTVWLANEA